MIPRRASGGALRAGAVAVLLAAAPVALAPGSAASADPDVAAQAAAQRAAFCGLVARCGLAAQPRGCSSASLAGLQGVAYDERRCAMPRELHSKGLTPEAPGAHAVYRFLGKRYQVHYAAAGTLPVAPAQFAWLLDHLPLAARLLRHYEGKDYRATWVRGSRGRIVWGSRGENLHGTAEEILGGPLGGNVYYLGFGVAELWRWRFVGEVLLEATYRPDPADPGATRYRMVAIAGPANGWIDAIMASDLFGELVEGVVEGTLADLAATVQALEAERVGGRLPADAPWTVAERRELRDLLALGTGMP